MPLVPIMENNYQRLKEVMEIIFPAFSWYAMFFPEAHSSTDTGWRLVAEASNKNVLDYAYATLHHYMDKNIVLEKQSTKHHSKPQLFFKQIDPEYIHDLLSIVRQKKLITSPEKKTDSSHPSSEKHYAKITFSDFQKAEGNLRKIITPPSTGANIFSPQLLKVKDIIDTEKDLTYILTHDPKETSTVFTVVNYTYQHVPSLLKVLSRDIQLLPIAHEVLSSENQWIASENPEPNEPRRTIFLVGLPSIKKLACLTSQKTTQLQSELYPNHSPSFPSVHSSKRNSLNKAIDSDEEKTPLLSYKSSDYGATPSTSEPKEKKSSGFSFSNLLGKKSVNKSSHGGFERLL